MLLAGGGRVSHGVAAPKTTFFGKQSFRLAPSDHSCGLSEAVRLTRCLRGAQLRIGASPWLGAGEWIGRLARPKRFLTPPATSEL